VIFNRDGCGSFDNSHRIAGKWDGGGGTRRGVEPDIHYSQGRAPLIVYLMYVNT
jgi:hypothetical protein